MKTLNDPRTEQSAAEPDSHAAPPWTRPARVLYVNGWSSCHGGSSTSLLDIVTHVDRRLVDPIVICPERGELPERLEAAGINVIIRRNVALSKKTLPAFALDVCRLCRFLRRERIDLVHMNTGGWRPSLAVAARILGVPYVQHVRNPINDVQSARANFGYRWARRIVTNSDAVGRPLRMDPAFQSKTLTIYNAVDLSRYAAPEQRRLELGAGDRPIVGFVGQIVPRKGVETLIRGMPAILESVPDALLVVVGCAPPDETEYEQSCRRLVTEMSLDRHVTFTGYRNDVPAWMHTFDVFVLPTREEPFGKVVIEAMAAGCPVVATAVGGIPEILCRPELGTLIGPDDPAATSAAVVRYLTQPELARQAGQAARAHARDVFGLDGMIRRLQELYEEVLGETDFARASRRKHPG